MFPDSRRSQELLLMPWSPTVLSQGSASSEVILSSAKGRPHWCQWPGTQLEAGPGWFWVVWHLWLINCTSYLSYFMNLPEIGQPICDQNIVIVFCWVKSREAEVVSTVASKPELCDLPLNSSALFLHTHSFSVFFYHIYLFIYVCGSHISLFHRIQVEDSKLPWGLGRSDSGHQAWQQTPLTLSHFTGP